MKKGGIKLVLQEEDEYSVVTIFSFPIFVLGVSKIETSKKVGRFLEPVVH